MAIGTHWEWRGFGAASAELAHKFARMAPHFARHRVTDTYLHHRALALNVKVRSGAEGGLKVKRMLGSDRCFERWQESADDIYALPLSEEACSNLEDLFRQNDLHLRLTAETADTADAFLATLRKAGCKTISVTKTRESRLLQTDEGGVIVDWAAIHRPQAVVSIGLENANPEGGHDDDPGHGLEQLRAALRLLELESEPLKALNYLQAVGIWADGRRIDVSSDPAV